MNTEHKKESVSQTFVNATIERIKNDRGLSAALRRADNPATEYQSWEYLANFNIALDNENKRLPYAIVAAAIAKFKIEHDGVHGIGETLASCYEENNDSDQAKAKLRRLLSCTSTKEVCRILRTLFSLIDSKSKKSLSFSKLLYDLLMFWNDDRRQRIKSKWAENFYRPSTKMEKNS